MACAGCKEPIELLEEGRAFIKEALAICQQCDIHPFTKNKQNCGCAIKFKIENNQLIKSSCPDGKW